jgi:hypothetical protein
MNRNIKEKIEGWDISLNRNVHMYTHSLSIKKGQNQFSVNCEDLPTKEKIIGIWLYNSNISENFEIELRHVLSVWINKLDIKFQIYTTPDNFFSNR